MGATHARRLQTWLSLEIKQDEGEERKKGLGAMTACVSFVIYIYLYKFLIIPGTNIFTHLIIIFIVIRSA